MAHRWTKTTAILTALCGISLLTACGDSGTGEGPPFSLCESSFVGEPSCFLPNFEEEVLRDKLVGCAGDPEAGACHVEGTGQSTMELDLTDPNASVEAEIGALIGQNGLGGPLVDPSCTDESYLLTKLTANPGGSRMPLNAAPWTNDEIECFRKYLDDTFAVE